MERLVRLIGVLAQHPKGAPSEKLMRAVGAPTAKPESLGRMLHRDLEQLNALGYDIRNVGSSGDQGRYVMRARDNRLQVHLTAEQRGELLRAALAAGLEGLAPHLGDAEAPTDRGTRPAGDPTPLGNLDLVARAATRRCLLRFVYKGEPRVVHPVRVHSGPSGWYLSAREEGGDVVKEYVVTRMSDVHLDAPGTAEAVRETPRPSLDPLRWLVDPPTDVELQTAPVHRRLVENLLGDPRSWEERSGLLHLTYRVTHRAVLRWRLYELGARVRVVGPEQVRDELLAELESLAQAHS